VQELYNGQEENESYGTEITPHRVSQSRYSEYTSTEVEMMCSQL